jgi:hypothetical protein
VGDVENRESGVTAVARMSEAICGAFSRLPATPFESQIPDVASLIRATGACIRALHRVRDTKLYNSHT